MRWLPCNVYQLKKIHILILERERKQEEGAEGERESLPQTGLDLMTLRSWLELKPRVGHLSNWATQASCTLTFQFLIFLPPQYFFWRELLSVVQNKQCRKYQKSFNYRRGIEVYIFNLYFSFSKSQGFVVNIHVFVSLMMTSSRIVIKWI